MPPHYVPLTLGSPQSRHSEIDAFRVTEAHFPAELRLPSHLHDRGSFVVILAGSVEIGMMNRHHHCDPTTVLIEPIDARHDNRFGSRGAHVLVVQPDPGRLERFAPVAPLLDEIVRLRHGGVAALAWRLVRELRRPDELTPLAMEGLFLEMLSLVARHDAPARSAPPEWLARVEARLREEPYGVDIASLASEAGVHPGHLVRVFRERYRVTPAAFVRRLRLEWALRRLADSREPISQIAVAAGFADQSHFTRVFKQQLGVTPGRFRRSVQSR